jgi:o-succinylbenzoate synthase
MDFREGFVLAVTAQSGEIGYGECAPLPGYSRESLSSALIHLRVMAHSLADFDLDPHDALAQAVSLLHDSYSASVRFAVESALLSLSAAALKKPQAALLSADFSPRVDINALIESADNLESHIASLADSNCRAVKLKVGRQSVNDDIASVIQVRRLLPDDISLRLDANRAWTLDDSSSFARGVSDCGIEYIEEPLRICADLRLFHERFPSLSLAIDESVLDMSLAQLQTANYLAAVVIKPTVIGGLTRAIQIADTCMQTVKMPVISAAIESSLGLSTLAHLASSLGLDIPIGLDTARLFATDLISPVLSMTNHSIWIENLYTSGFSLNTAVLDEVPLA